MKIIIFLINSDIFWYMNLLFISPHLNLGLSVVDKLAHVLSKRGHKIILLSKSSPKNYWKKYSSSSKQLDGKVSYLFYDNSKLSKVNFFQRQYLTSSLVLDQVKSITSLKKVDLIFCISIDSQAAQICLQPEIPIVLRVNQTINDYYKYLKLDRQPIDAPKKIEDITDEYINYYLAHLWEIETYKRVSHIIVDSKYVLDEIKEYNSTSVIYSGVDTEIYKRKKNNNLETDLNLDNNTVITYVGRIHPSKGIDIFIKVGKKLLMRKKDIKFLIIGPKEIKNYSEKIKSEIEDIDNFLFLGPIESQNIADYLSLSDIFLFPSKFESTSNALLEAMACENIVVTFNNSSMAEIISNGKEGYLAENYKEMENIMFNLVLNTPKEIGKNARKKIVDKFSFGQMVDQYERIFYDICKK